MAQGSKVPAVARYWPGGMDSYTIADQLRAIDYVFGLNVVNRGGIVQTRPGSDPCYCLPDGNPQGFCMFTPASGIPHQVSVIDGNVYASPYPFRDYFQLEGLQFNPASRLVVMKPALKSTDYDPNGELLFLEQPYKVLMFQDMSARAGFWDGTIDRHLNPEFSDTEVTIEGFDETRIGLHMVFSNGRLWVAYKNMVFASDIGNPLKFTEAQYLNEAPAFYLPDDCTGMIETPDQGGILCGHSLGVDFIESSIIDRTQWLRTPNMQRTIVPLGCVAGRSMINHNNTIYWFSPKGLINLNQALSTYQTSELRPLDHEMAWSKALIAPDLVPICCGSFENYLLVSVPACGLENRHTWAMDFATFDGGERSWNAVWTGHRPVEWSTATVNGQDRCFFLSKDSDGHNRVWEHFKSHRTDAGCAITCSMQMRTELFGSDELKKWLFAEIDLCQIYGELSFMAAVAGTRGWFDRVLTKEIVASDGRIDTEVEYGDEPEDPKMGGNRSQVRTIRTQQWTTPSPCNACGVESDLQNNIDYGFELFLAWSGRCGVRSVRQQAITQTEPFMGTCEKDETGVRTLTQEGCASKELNPVVDPFPHLLADATVEGPGLDNDASLIRVSATATSQISQADAVRKASCHAGTQYSRLARDPDLSEIHVQDGNLTVDVFGLPDIGIYNEAGTVRYTLENFIDFGVVPCGETGEVVLRLQNNGIGNGNLESVMLEIAERFTILVPPPSMFVPAGGFVLTTVQFTAPPCP